MFLNKESVFENLGIDEEVYREVLETFVSSYEDTSDDGIKLRNLLQNSAEQILQTPVLCENLCKMSHKIKGAALTIGAEKLGNSAAELETLLKSDNTFEFTDRVCKLNSVLNEFKIAYVSTIREIKSY